MQTFERVRRMHHREPSHLEEWAALLGDDLADDLVDADDSTGRFTEDEPT